MVIQLTTFLTLSNSPACTPSPALQSSGRYGLAMLTASSTMIFAPLHLVGRVLYSASNISCASFPTPLPFRASSSFRRAIAWSTRDWRTEAGGRGTSAGRAELKLDVGGEERLRRVTDWMDVMGRMCQSEEPVVGFWFEERASWLVRGSAVKRVPSRVG